MIFFCWALTLLWIQSHQSYSYIMRKVCYHQIWIQNNLGFMVLILLYILHSFLLFRVPFRILWKKILKETILCEKIETQSINIIWWKRQVLCQEISFDAKNCIFFTFRKFVKTRTRKKTMYSIFTLNFVEKIILLSKYKYFKVFC